MTHAESVRAAAVQFEHVFGNKAKNLSVINDFVERASALNVGVIAFPEMCITGYWDVRNLSAKELYQLAEDIPHGDSTQQLLKLAKKHNIIIGAGLIEKASPVSPSDQQQNTDYFNSYVVALPDGRHFTHRKIHSFEHPLIKEGNSYTVFDSFVGDQPVRFGVLICYDNNIPENSREMGLSHVDILLAPHQTGGTNSRSAPRVLGQIDPQLWHNRYNNPEDIKAEFMGPKGDGFVKKLIPSIAWTNGMFVVFANGVGFDGGEIRTGGAMIVDPYGDVLAETHKLDNDLVIADIDLSLLKNAPGRRHQEQRRPELYRLQRTVDRTVTTRDARMSIEK